MKKILIVDDNPNLILYVEKKLRDAGHEVIVESDGLVAVNRLVDYTPDIIFLDFFLPNINGDKLCKIIRKMEHLHNTYLVVMSAAAKEMQLDASMVCADTLIAKGTFKVTTEHLFQAIADSEKPRTDDKERGGIMGIESIQPSRMTVELLDKYRHLQTILDSISEGVIEVYRGQIVYANPAAATMFDTRQDQLLAAYPASFFGDGERPRIETLMKSDSRESVLVERKGPAQSENRVMSIRKLPLLGEPDTTILLITDITERMLSEKTLLNYQDHLEALVDERTAELRRAAEKLHQAQKMEAIGTFAGGIAHDFNNILTVLIGFGTLLKMGIEENDPLMTCVEEILSSSKRAARLTQSLLAFTRKQPMALEALALNKNIASTQKLLKRLLTEDIELRANLTSDSTTIMGDASQIDQILINLATNARDAMPQGGTLTIETKRLTLDGEFEDVHGYGKPGEYVLLSVSDTGTGIDAETCKQVFDPFFTTKEVGKGTGLGLSTVYGIVRQHSGYIHVTSEPGSGTTFRVYFPVAAKAATEEGSVSSMTLRGGNETILIAEDNKGVRKFLKTTLSRFGYTVIEAIDGEDAIDKFKEHTNIDLMIVDSVMPKKNGKEVHDEIKRLRSDVKVLFTSGHTKDVIFEKGLNEEFHFLPKPMTPHEILKKVREVLE